MRVERDAVGLEEGRLLDTSAPLALRVVVPASPTVQATATRGTARVPKLALCSTRPPRVRKRRPPTTTRVLRVDAHVRALRVEERLCARADRARLALQLRPDGHDVLALELRLGAGSPSRSAACPAGTRGGPRSRRTMSVPTRSPARGRYGPESSGLRESQSCSAKPARSSWLVRPRTWRKLQAGHADLALVAGVEVGTPVGGLARCSDLRSLRRRKVSRNDVCALALEAEGRRPAILAQRAVGLLVVRAQVDAAEVPIEAASPGRRCPPRPGTSRSFHPAPPPASARPSDSARSRDGPLPRAHRCRKRLLVAPAHDLDAIELEGSRGPRLYSPPARWREPRR